MRAHATSALLLTAAALATAWGSVARAICGLGPVVTLRPHGDTAAPLNTHAWLQLPRDWRTRAPRSTVDPRACEAGDFDLALRTAPATGTPSSEAPSDTRESQGGAFAGVEVAPRAPLLARTHYEVWLVDRASRAGRLILGVFATGEATDTLPPTWSGTLTGSRSFAASQRAARSRPGVITIPSECGDELFALFGSGSVIDDSTARADLRFAVWTAPAGAPIDYTRPPAAYEQAYLAPADGTRPEVTITVGSTESTLSDFDLPPNTRALHVGVRALDLAGNMSPAREVVVGF